MAETAPVIQCETGVVIGPAKARRGTGQLSETVPFRTSRSRPPQAATNASRTCVRNQCRTTPAPSRFCDGLFNGHLRAGRDAIGDRGEACKLTSSAAAAIASSAIAPATRRSTILYGGCSTGPPAQLPYGRPASVHRVGEGLTTSSITSLSRVSEGDLTATTSASTRLPVPVPCRDPRPGDGGPSLERVFACLAAADSSWPSGRRGQGRDAVVLFGRVWIGHTVLHQAQRIDRTPT
jgi:hypothetical protein